MTLEFCSYTVHYFDALRMQLLILMMTIRTGQMQHAMLADTRKSRLSQLLSQRATLPPRESIVIVQRVVGTTTMVS